MASSSNSGCREPRNEQPYSSNRLVGTSVLVELFLSHLQPNRQPVPAATQGLGVAAAAAAPRSYEAYKVRMQVLDP